MAQRRHHYEQAFETYLRSKRIPYISVDEARKALLPDGARLAVRHAGAPAAGDERDRASPDRTLKSFDFVVYTPGGNLLVDVKGRRIGRTPVGGRGPGMVTIRSGRGRLENWVTRADIDSLSEWQRLFGEGFRAAFLFIYWCEAQPPDALFQEVFEHRGRWYAVRAVLLDDYARVMKQRSPRWATVDLASAEFERVSQPFCGAGTF